MASDPRMKDPGTTLIRRPEISQDLLAPNRRKLIVTGLGAGLAASGGLVGAVHAQTATERPDPNAAIMDQIYGRMNVCRLSAQAVEGPFFIEHELSRSDLREGQRGEPLRLRLRVLNGNNLCVPVRRAAVSIWQANARGIYSGYVDRDPNRPLPERGEVLRGADENGHVQEAPGSRFLRGMQETDSEGVVSFTTIFPGWYTTRTPHIHVRVYTGGRQAVTTQLYFPQTLINHVNTRPIYVDRGPGLTSNDNDFVRRQSNAGSESMFMTSFDPDGAIVANAVLGISNLAY